MSTRNYLIIMTILAMVVVAVWYDVATAQSIGDRVHVCDGRIITPMPDPTWTPDAVMSAMDAALPSCNIGAYGEFWACIAHTTIWECGQFGIVNDDARIWGNVCPGCLSNCDSCTDALYLPVILKSK